MSERNTTAVPAAAAHYNLAQILLHWGIAALVVWQLVFGESLPGAERLARQGQTADAATAFLADSHIWVGFAILALMTLRLILRLRRGTLHGEAANGLAAAVARWSHNLFYFLLFLMPITGILDYYFRLPTGGIHELGKPAFVVLIALHAAAALWHAVIRRDGTMRQMLVPAR